MSDTGTRSPIMTITTQNQLLQEITSGRTDFSRVDFRGITINVFSLGLIDQATGRYISTAKIVLNFTGANFTGATITNLLCDHVNFTGAKFTATILKNITIGINVLLTNTKFIAANITNMNIVEVSYDKLKVKFGSADFTYATIKQSDLSSGDFSHAIFTNSTLSKDVHLSENDLCVNETIPQDYLENSIQQLIHAKELISNDNVKEDCVLM